MVIKKFDEFIEEQKLDESFINAIKNVKDKIFNKKEREEELKDSEIERGNKKVEMEEVIDAVEKELKDSHKNPEELLKDIAEIVKKDMNSFNEIVPTLHKWVETHDRKKYYSFDTLIGDDKCQKYIVKLCNTLADKYDWDGLRIEWDEEYEEDEEAGVVVYNTAYIAFMLSSISEEL